MKKYLVLCLAGLLASCTGSRQLPAAHMTSEPVEAASSHRQAIALPPLAIDSLPPRQVAPSPGLLRRLFSGAQQPAGSLPRKCKNCQITMQTGTGNTSTQAATAKKGQTLGEGASNIEKAKAPVATNAGTAQDFTKQAQRGGAAASGDHAQAEATKASGWPWWLWLLLVVGVAAGGYRLYKRFTPT